MNGNINSALNINGQTFRSNTARTGTGHIGHEIPLSAGKVGTLTTRTDNDTGVATMVAGHGLATSDVVDVYWATGSRFGMTATVATNAVTIDGGTGDNLPSTSTALIVAKAIVIDTDVDGDLLSLIAVGSDVRAGVHFKEGGGTSILRLDLPGDELWSWASGQGIANPLTGNAIGQVTVSSGEAVAGTFNLGALYASS